MARLTGLVAAAAAVLGLTGSVAFAQTLASRGPLLPAADSVPQAQQAHLTLGSIHGVVLDDRGAPIADAMVSALSPLSTRLATTDVRGRFRIEALPYGEYIVRVHHPGYMSARRDGVRVGLSGSVTSDLDRIQMRRLDAASAPRPVMTAGMAP